MDNEKLRELRNHYDATDTSPEIADAEVDDEIIQSPMIGITIRLPREVLQNVRQMASRERIKPTALIRRWTEEAVEADHPTLAPAAHIEQLLVGGLVKAPDVSVFRTNHAIVFETNREVDWNRGNILCGTGFGDR